MAHPPRSVGWSVDAALVDCKPGHVIYHWNFAVWHGSVAEALLSSTCVRESLMLPPTSAWVPEPRSSCWLNVKSTVWCVKLEHRVPAVTCRQGNCIFWSENAFPLPRPQCEILEGTADCGLWHLHGVMSCILNGAIVWLPQVLFSVTTLTDYIISSKIEIPGYLLMAPIACKQLALPE